MEVFYISTIIKFSLLVLYYNTDASVDQGVLVAKKLSKDELIKKFWNAVEKVYDRAFPVSPETLETLRTAFEVSGKAIEENQTPAEVKLIDGWYVRMKPDGTQEMWRKD